MAGLVPPLVLGNKGAMNAGLALMRGAVREIVDFALPPRCPGCGAITQDPHRFCLDCWQATVFLGDPSCARCGLPFGYDSGEDAECGACIADPPAFDRLRAAVAYGETARHVALKLKYGGQPGVAETLARFMERHLADCARDTLLVPVPLHRWRIWKRGYNQSALVASALGRRTGLAVELDAIRRIRATPPLKGLNRRERAITVRGVFAMSRAGAKAVAGRPIVLIDDVYTSGATANACARVLRRAGAAQVNILCWARVVAGTDN